MGTKWIPAVLCSLPNNPSFPQSKNDFAWLLFWKILLDLAGRIVLPLENTLLHRPGVHLSQNRHDRPRRLDTTDSSAAALPFRASALFTRSVHDVSRILARQQLREFVSDNRVDMSGEGQLVILQRIKLS